MKPITKLLVFILSFSLFSCDNDDVVSPDTILSESWLFLSADPADDLYYDSYSLDFKERTLTITKNNDPSCTEDFTYEIKDSKLILSSPKYDKSYSFPIKQDGEKLKFGNYFPILDINTESALRSPEWSVYFKYTTMDSFEGTDMISKWKDKKEGSEMIIYKDKIVIKGMPVGYTPDLTGTFRYEVNGFDSEYLVSLYRAGEELPCASLLFSEISGNSMKVMNVVSSYGIEYHMAKE